MGLENDANFYPKMSVPVHSPEESGGTKETQRCAQSSPPEK